MTDGQPQLVWQTLASHVLPDQRQMFSLTNNDGVAVSRHYISRAKRCIKQLQADYWAALTHEVGNPNQWESRLVDIFQKLQALSAEKNVHEVSQENLLLDTQWYAASVGEQVIALLQVHPELESLVIRLGWYCLSWRQPPRQALRVMQRHGAAITRAAQIDSRLALQLVLLVARHPKHQAGLLALLGSGYLRLVLMPERYMASLTKQLHDVNAVIDWSNNTPACHRHNMAQDSRVWLQWLFDQDDKMAKRACELLDACNLPMLLEAYVIWHKRVSSFAKRLQRARKNPAFFHKKSFALRRKWVEQADRLATHEVAPVYLSAALSTIRCFAADSVLHQHLGVVVKRMAAVGAAQHTAEGNQASVVLNYLVYAAEFAADEQQRYTVWLSCLQSFLSSAPDSVLKLWIEPEFQYRWQLPDQHCLNETTWGRQKWQSMLSGWLVFAQQGITFKTCQEFTVFMDLFRMGLSAEKMALI